MIKKKKKYRYTLHRFFRLFQSSLNSSSIIFNRISFFFLFEDPMMMMMIRHENNASRRVFSNRVSKDIVRTKVKRELCFLADYVSGGELFTHLYQREHFTEDEVRIYIGEVILALEHLHKVNSFFHSSPLS